MEKMNTQGEKLIILPATDADNDYLEARLEEHTNKILPSYSNKITEYFYTCIKEDGEVVAGILAESYYKTVLYIDILWVKEGYRHKGYGTALIQHAEEKAAAAGCTTSVLSTYTFQARGLYEKLGYTVFGTIQDCPVKGHSDFYLSKSLKDAAQKQISNNKTIPYVEIQDASNDDNDVIVQGIISNNKSHVPFTQSPNNVWFDMCIKDGDEMVAGISSKSSCWKTFYLLDLWVKEEYRNKGYATALIRDVEKQAKDFGCEVAILETFNPAMRQLCEKLGYIVHGELENYPQGHTRYYMTKKL
jgi:GNAT superfamily N-acetyltransferase